MKENLEEGKVNNGFLEKLKNAVESGDPTKGADSINKINEIHKLASSMNGDIANSKFEKRVENAGLKDVILPEERKIMSVESERERLKIEKEEEKLKFMADIQNGEYEIKAVKSELKEVILQYEKVIEMQEEELRVLKIKYEAKYDKKYEEEKTKE